jgi:hypothetical protein
MPVDRADHEVDDALGDLLGQRLGSGGHPRRMRLAPQEISNACA